MIRKLAGKPDGEIARKHSGTIYKATNWIYAGQNKGDTVWVDRLGRQVSKRAGPWGKGRRTRTVAEMEAVGFRRKGKSSKIRFIFPRNP